MRAEPRDQVCLQVEALQMPGRKRNRDAYSSYTASSMGTQRRWKSAGRGAAQLPAPNTALTDIQQAVRKRRVGRDYSGKMLKLEIWSSCAKRLGVHDVASITNAPALKACPLLLRGRMLEGSAMLRSLVSTSLRDICSPRWSAFLPCWRSLQARGLQRCPRTGVSKRDSVMGQIRRQRSEPSA